MKNIINLVNNELEGATIEIATGNYIRAWWPDKTGIEYAAEAREIDGCWISSHTLEPEGGTVWGWADPMFYPYNG